MLAFSILLLFLPLIASQAGHTVSECGWMPDALAESALVYDGQDSIYILGGKERDLGATIESRKVQKYNIHNESFETVGYFPRPVTGGVATLDLNRVILYFGGQVNSYDSSAAIYKIRLDNLTPELLETILEYSEKRPHGCHHWEICLHFWWRHLREPYFRPL
jgi:hypothetical protein